MSQSDLSRQYTSSLSILAVSLFIGLPIWWKTTEVYRCSLPYKEIGELSNKHVPPELAIKVSIALISDSDDGSDRSIDLLVAQLRKELVVGSISARNTRVAIHYIIQTHKLGSKDKSKLLSYLQSDDLEDFSSHVSTLLPSSLGHYFILLVPDKFLSHVRMSPASDLGLELSAFVSGYRHTLIRVQDEKDLSSSLAVVMKVIHSVYGDRKHLEKSLKNSAGVNQDQVDVESMRQLRASLGYHLSFTLLNPDPSKVQSSWNIHDSTNDILMPFLEHDGISSLGDFSISSQEFYYTDMKFYPKKDGNSFYVTQAYLPPMISSIESKLASHVSQFPSLNFLVYIPKRTESPLFIRPSSSSSDEHSQTDNFLVPQWGGMIIYNPGKLSQSIVESNLSGEDNGSVLVNVKMEKLMPIFIKQFKILLGISNIPINSDKGEGFVYSPGKYGIVDWKIDQLLLGKLLESVSMATTSLVSLVQLLDKVKNMVISDHIQHEVEYSLLSIQECYKQASIGNLSLAYQLSKKAMKSAEIAFFDPSILELLYFPDDQKFAIYIPLFLPISIPILFSSMAALKWVGAWIRGKKSEIDNKKESIGFIHESSTDSSVENTNISNSKDEPLNRGVASTAASEMGSESTLSVTKAKSVSSVDTGTRASICVDGTDETEVGSED